MCVLGLHFLTHHIGSRNLRCWFPWPQGGDGCGVLFEKLPAAGGPRVLPKVGRTPQESWFLHPCSFLMLIYIYIYYTCILFILCIFLNVDIHIFISIEYIHTL